MSFVKRATSAAVRVLRREPVAAWGVVVAAAIGLVTTLTGHDVSTVVDVVLPLVGIPVVRGKVTPIAALKALVDGAARK